MPHPRKDRHTLSRRQVHCLRIAVLVLAVMAAHGGCLDSTTYYLDDSHMIHESEYVEGGQWWMDPGMLLPNLSYYLTWKMAGHSAFAFHLGNLAIHFMMALSIYLLAPHLFAIKKGIPEKWQTTAWVAALIFAVHPLTTEITNYVRARDHALVGLFAFWTAGFTVLAFRQSWKWAFAVAAAIILGTFSKGPGLPHALLSCGIASLACLTTHYPTSKSANAYQWKTPAIFLAGTAVIWLAHSHVAYLWQHLTEEVSQSRFWYHALTQCRVLPGYLWRMVLPVGLSSDHHIAWTTDALDPVSWAWAALISLLLAALAILWIKKIQPLALILSLILLPLMLRWLYIVSELLVEYRAYPSMPFAAMLLALGFYHWKERQPRLSTATLTLILVIFASLSQVRSRDWTSTETLHHSILKKEPLQLRAMNGLTEEDLRKGRYQAILDRNPEFMRRFRQVLELNRASTNRYYENWPLWITSEECSVAEAIAHVRSPEEAQAYCNKIAWNLNQNQIVHPFLWAQWHLIAGKIAFMEGQKSEALRHYMAAYPIYLKRLPVDREIMKIVPCAPPYSMPPDPSDR